MRKAARILEKMHAHILKVMEPGMRKNDLVTEIYHSAISGVSSTSGARLWQRLSGDGNDDANRSRCFGSTFEIGRSTDCQQFWNFF